MKNIKQVFIYPRKRPVVKLQNERYFVTHYITTINNYDAFAQVS